MPCFVGDQSIQLPETSSSSFVFKIGHMISIDLLEEFRHSNFCASADMGTLEKQRRSIFHNYSTYIPVIKD